MLVSIIIIIIATIVIILDIIFLVWLKCSKTVRPSRKLRKIAIIKKSKVNKKNVYRIIPKDQKEKQKIICYFHGGAYAAGITKGYWNFVYNLVKDTSYEIIFPDYPLIPKYTYKDVYDMVEKIYYKFLINKDVIFIGDSAGGTIALGFYEKLFKENRKVPIKTILISPWLDISLDNSKIDEVQKYDKILNKTALKLAGKVYAGNQDINCYLLSPLKGPIDKINNLIVFSGTYDILNPDVHVLEKMVDMKLYETKEASHIWIINEREKYEDEYRLLISEILD